MKIYFYLPNAESGGAENVIISLANEFSKKDYQVVLILGKAQGAFIYKIFHKVKIIEIGNTSILKTAFKLYSLVSKEAPDILCVTKNHVNTVVALFTPFFKKTKVILREANTPSIEYLNSGLYGKIIMNISKITYRFSDKFIAVSNGVRDDMAGFYKLKKSSIQTIYNPVISEEFYKESNEKVSHTFFEEQKLNSKVYIFVAVGRLMPQKDYPTMIESFNQAYSINKNIRLIILGRIEKYNLDYEIVQNNINTNQLDNVIDFVGFVSNPFKYLRKANCFIQTSLFEGLPGTLVQALGLKKDIIATNCKSGPEEILDFGKYGTLVEIGNINQISEQIINYSTGKQNRKADDMFIKQFTLDVSVNKYEQLFKILN